MQVSVVALVANVENTWTPPDGTASVEIRADTAADVRLSYVAGGTADGGNYFVFNPDWWTNEGKEIDLASTHIFYFRCAQNNTLRIMAGFE